MKSSPARILAVTAGLMAGGALFGATAAVIALVLALALTDGLALASEPAALAFTALCGGLLGAPLLPFTGWLLLRRVPVGLTLAGTMVGTVLGGVLGMVASTLDKQALIWPIAGALAGFALSAIVMRLRFSSPRPTEAIRVPRGAGA